MSKYTESTLNNSTDDDDSDGYFGGFSELHLDRIDLPKTSTNPIVPNELNDYLRDQLHMMKNENASLRLELEACAQKEAESRAAIGGLHAKARECLPSQTDLVSAQQVAQTKIMELSKKLREKSAEMEACKTKYAKLKGSFAQVRAQLDKEQGEPKEKLAEEPDLVKKLQDKLSSVTGKWAEEKNQSAKLKNDLKLANKWLQQEVGEKFETLLLLNNNQSNWRGRAQIIRDLQQKNQTLKEKLKNSPEKNTPSDLSIHSRFEKKVETIEKESNEIRANYEEMKRKYEAGRARCKVLESECNVFKTKCAALNEKCDFGQKTIAELTAQVSSKSALQNDEVKEREQTIKKLQTEIAVLKVEVDKQKCNVEHRSLQLQEKEDELKALARKVRSARPPSAFQHSSSAKDAKAVSRLEAERLRLLELTEVQNRRLEEERNAHFKTQTQFRIEKKKGAKLESNLLRVELEQKCHGGYSSRSLTNVRKVETNIEDKLELAEENVKALATRLEIEIYERQNDIKEFAKILKNYEAGDQA